MRRPRGHPRWVFWTAVARWSGALVLLAFVNQLLSAAMAGEVRLLGILLLVPGWIGLLLPFTAFAGGVAVRSNSSSRALFSRGLAIAGISYVFLAFGAPLGDYLIEARSGVTPSLVYPAGPRTPTGLLELRSAIEADPPEVFSFRVEAPLTLPPNWLTYLLHSAGAVALYSFLSVILGYRTAGLTSGLSPPNRRNARWGVGLVLGVAFFLGETSGGNWVRGDPSRSRIMGAWVPLLIPVLFLLLLEGLSRYPDLRGGKARGIHGPRPHNEGYKKDPEYLPRGKHMTCPELDELIDFYHGHAGPAVEAHLEGCPSCRADLETLIALPLLWGLEVEVPDRLVQSVLERLPVETQDPEARVTWGQRLGTGVLGTLTGGITILVTGSPGATNLSAALVLSLMAGILAGIPRGARIDVADDFGHHGP